MSERGVQCPYCDGKKYVCGRDYDDSHVKYACGPCNATGVFISPSDEIDELNRTRRSLRLERDKLLAEIKLLRGQLTRANKRIEEQADILRRIKAGRDYVPDQMGLCGTGEGMDHPWYRLAKVHRFVDELPSGYEETK